MKNKEEIINALGHKLPYIAEVCICILLMIYLKNRRAVLLKLYPNDKLTDFIWKYVQNNSHEIEIFILLICLAMVISIYSIYSLVKRFRGEEIIEQVINSILILCNMVIIVIILVSNWIVFKYAFFIIIASFVVLALFAGFWGRSNT